MKIERVLALTFAPKILNLGSQRLQRLHHPGIELVLMRAVEESDSIVRSPDQFHLCGRGLNVLEINQNIGEAHTDSVSGPTSWGRLPCAGPDWGCRAIAPLFR